MSQFSRGDLVAYVKGTDILWYVLTSVEELKGVQVEITKSSKDALTFITLSKPKKLNKTNCTLYRRKELLNEIKKV